MLQRSSPAVDDSSGTRLTRNALEELQEQLSAPHHPSRPESPCDPQALPNNLLVHIRHFAEDGGPDLRDLRGYPSPKCPAPGKISDKNSYAYNDEFDRALIRAGLYSSMQHHPDGHLAKPNNFDQITSVLARKRPYLTQPSKYEFEEFVGEARGWTTKKEVMDHLFPMLRGELTMAYETGRTFDNLAPLAEHMMPAKPDFYDGACETQLDECIQALLDKYIIPTKKFLAPILPNFLCETKGSGSERDIAVRAALHNGALGARGMHLLQSFLKDSMYDGCAYTITGMYLRGELTLFSVHPMRSSNPQINTEYHMTKIGFWDLAESRREFRKGVGALRNAREWALEQRDLFINKANRRMAESTKI